VRNNDALLETLLEDLSAVDARDLDEARSRMHYGIRTVDDLLRRLVEKQPDLRMLLQEVRRDLPRIAD
jgi:hypothetical protein